MSLLRLYLWIVPHLLVGLCVFGLLRRKRCKQYPIFVTYLVVELVQFLMSVILNVLLVHSLCSRDVYQWTIVVATGISSVLEFGVLYELANELVLRRSSLAPVLRPLLRWAMVILLLTAAVVSALLSAPGLRRVMAVFQTLDFSASLTQIGLLLILLLFTRALHISWRSLPAGIALGFATTASTEMAASALLSELGHSYYIRIDILRMIGFHVCVLVWMTYIFLPEKPATSAGTGLQKPELEFWDQELQKMVGR